MSERLLSDSEIGRVMTCQAQWDFSYGNQLAGHSLKAKRVPPLLSAGRAWGAAAAAFHACNGIDGINPGTAAIEALRDSLEDDADRQREFGVFDAGEHTKQEENLLAILLHYVHTTDPWVAGQTVEHEVRTPIPSRSGKGKSNRYKFLGYIDATREIGGRPWLVEFKLRKQLTTVEFIQLNRQIRRYAWAWWQSTGIKPAGVEVHERLNERPRAPRMVKGRKKSDAEMVPSHSKDQLTTVEAYEANCAEHNVSPDPNTVIALGQRRWQQVVPIIFREGELEEAGRELVSAGQLIHDLDIGKLYPVRNAKPQNCRGCAFREICPSPDPMLVEALFELKPAKRDRSEDE